MSIDISIIIKCAVSSIKFIEKILETDPFNKIANSEFEIANKYFEAAKNSKNIEELKFGLIHLEVASSLISSSSFWDKWPLNSPKRQKTDNFNALCYQIASIHYELGHDYSIIKYWSDQTLLDSASYLPYGFSNILSVDDFEIYSHRFDIEHRDSCSREWDEADNMEWCLP